MKRKTTQADWEEARIIAGASKLTEKDVKEFAERVDGEMAAHFKKLLKEKP